MTPTAANLMPAAAITALLASFLVGSQPRSVAAAASAARLQRGDNQLYVVLPRDAIPAINDPEFEPVEEAERGMADEEIVIGLVGDREQRAYSTWQLDRHEIVNDVFEGQPVAVTWCPLCGTGIVYARTVCGRVLTFGVSGMLFHDALVMYDRDTETLWTHVDGRAIKGSFVGHSLEPLPAVHATWKQWKGLYPDSLVLKKRGEFRSSYESYNRDPSTLGIFGRRNQDTQLPPKARILGVRADAAATAFPLAEIRKARIVNTQVSELAIVLTAPATNLPVVVYDRRVRNRVLTFAVVERTPTVIRDVETGTTWQLSDGTAVEGEMRGERLARVTAHPAFWFGWQGYFPYSKVWRPANP